MKNPTHIHGPGSRYLLNGGAGVRVSLALFTALTGGYSGLPLEAS